MCGYEVRLRLGDCEEDAPGLTEHCARTPLVFICTIQSLVDEELTIISVIEIVSHVKLNKSRRLGSLVDCFLRGMLRYDGGRGVPILHAASLTSPQIAALEFTGEPQIVSAVATYLGLSRPATSHMIDKLARLGLLRRVEGTTDRRERHVILTAKGRALVDRIAATRAARFDSSLAVLTPGVAARLDSILNEVIGALDAANASAASRSSPSRNRDR